MSTRNIILFGESGAGKSSIINMLSDSDNVAKTSSDAEGCTFDSCPYNVKLHEVPMTLWDTAGLDEGDAGRVPKSEAIIQLYQLVRKLGSGVSLLIFVMRGPRVRESVPQNWKLFHDIICQRKVPALILITGLESIDDGSSWWRKNKGVFQRYGILPAGAACITATRGKKQEKGRMYDVEFEASKEKVRDLISSCYLEDPWRATAVQWLKIIAREVTEVKGGCFGSAVVTRKQFVKAFGEAAYQLISACGLSKNEAEEVVRSLKGK